MKTFMQSYIEEIANSYNKNADSYKFERALRDEYGIRLRGGYFVNLDGDKIAKLLPQYSSKKVCGCYKVLGYKLQWLQSN